jgi:UDP-2-acetamido-2,6-beta-L-arabino-hexul-4-ose reductase
MRILITGSDGFIGKNLITRLSENKVHEILTFNRLDPIEKLHSSLLNCDLIFHLAGANRPINETDFFSVNVKLSEKICAILQDTRHNIPLIFTSSVQALEINPYGASKLQAEEVFSKFSKDTGNSVLIFRLPGIFGKWCNPNYNSVVATFCYNISRNLPVSVVDPNCILNIIYIDALIDSFLDIIHNINSFKSLNFITPKNQNQITVNNLYELIKSFNKERDNLLINNFDTLFFRQLYSTFVSYLPPARFAYGLHVNSDSRGKFVELIKSASSGLFSFFTILPNKTRGGHYHHFKTERFILIKGTARFSAMNILSGEYFETILCENNLQVVESIPGWSHQITNIGEGEVISFLWSNEIFDRNKPDTIPLEIKNG